MIDSRNDTTSRQFLSWRSIIAILFSVMLVLGSSGIGLGGLFLQQQQRREVYAQEDPNFDTFPDESVPPETDTTAQGEICDNFFDDDGDGFTDSDDTENCPPVGGGQPNFEICDDFIDDDGDGFTDSDDPEGCTPLNRCDLIREMRAQDCPVEEGQSDGSTY